MPVHLQVKLLRVIEEKQVLAGLRRTKPSGRHPHHREHNGTRRGSRSRAIPRDLFYV